MVKTRYWILSVFGLVVIGMATLFIWNHLKQPEVFEGRESGLGGERAHSESSLVEITSKLVGRGIDAKKPFLFSDLLNKMRAEEGVKFFRTPMKQRIYIQFDTTPIADWSEPKYLTQGRLSDGGVCAWVMLDGRCAELNEIDARQNFTGKLWSVNDNGTETLEDAAQVLDRMFQKR